MILIWVDAHADINTNKTSESGSVHGMPVALLVKELADYWPYLPTMDWQVPKYVWKNYLKIFCLKIQPASASLRHVKYTYILKSLQPWCKEISIEMH